MCIFWAIVMIAVLEKAISFAGAVTVGGCELLFLDALFLTLVHLLCCLAVGVTDTNLSLARRTRCLACCQQAFVHGLAASVTLRDAFLAATTCTGAACITTL